MTLVVRDFMTPKLVYVEDGTRLRVVIHPILELGITTVPVLDSEHRPVGVISLRDLVEKPGQEPPVAKPALQIEVTASIDKAARRLADAAAHDMVVVDGDGRAVGMLSSLDIVRAFLHTRPLDAV